MAEIILPPEENEETPQVPELNIDKPTENSKVITIEFEAKKTNKVSTKDTNQQLYTTDTDAWFEFKETTLENANGTYSVVFRNRHDGSIFQRTGDVVNGVAYYKIPHQEIRHAGAWRGQVVYTLSNGDTTSREFGYDVKGHMLDGKDVREIIVEDFETLMSQLRSMKDNAEVELANLVNTANQNETNRQAFFDDLVNDIELLQTNYQELLDTGVLQTNINTKLEALEEEYAPKLTEVTAQLAQTAKKSDVANLSSATPLFADNITEMTNTSRPYVNTSDGMIYLYDSSTDVFTNTGVQYQAPGLGRATINNLVQNANMESTAFWADTYASNKTASNNEITFTPTERFGQVRHAVRNTIANHKYYVAMMVKSTSNEVTLDWYSSSGGFYATVNHSGGGEYELHSTVAEVTVSGVTQLRVVDYRTEGFDEIGMTKPVVVDLTSVFGEGNEPTKEEFEKMISESNSGSHFFIGNLQINVLIADKIYPQPLLKGDVLKSPLFVKVENEIVNVISKYSYNEDLRVRLEKKGVNNIFDFRLFYKIFNEDMDTSDDISGLTTFNTNSSDWFAPYKIAAVNNIDGDNPNSEYFTGGNHGYDNTGNTDNNSPTGRTAELKFFVDGREVKNYEGHCNYIEVKWTNRIQAYNTTKADGTGREVLEERYSMFFDGVKWSVKNEIEALEPLIWKAYYGLQLQRNAWKHQLRYVSSLANRKWNDATVASNAGDRNCTAIIMKNDNGDYVEMALRTDVDLGRGDYLSAAHNAYASDSKSYFYLVSGEKEVDAGELFEVEGHYRFYRTA